LTPGGLYEREQYGLVMVAPPLGVNSDGERHTAGQVLVEHEPIRYEVSQFLI